MNWARGCACVRAAPRAGRGWPRLHQDLWEHEEGSSLMGKVCPMASSQTAGIFGEAAESQSDQTFECGSEGCSR